MNQNRTTDTRREYGAAIGGETGSYFRHRLAAGRAAPPGVECRQAVRRRWPHYRGPTSERRGQGVDVLKSIEQLTHDIVST